MAAKQKRRHRRRRHGGRFGIVTTCISITLVLVLLGVVVSFVTICGNYSRQLREGLTVELTLSDSITKPQLLHVQDELRRAPYSRRINYISKERGTREMNAALQGDMGDFLGVSPIPAEFEVYLHADYANLDSLRRYEKTMRALPGVTDVCYPHDIMAGIDRTIPAVGGALLVVAALLTVVSFSLINNTVRLSVYSHRYSIHTMKLVGAKWSFIRRPFLLAALRIGATSVLLAGTLLGGTLYFLQFEVGGGELYVSTLITPFVWTATLGTIAVCGLLLTALCSLVSVSRYLRMDTGSLYLR